MTAQTPGCGSTSDARKRAGEATIPGMIPARPVSVDTETLWVRIRDDLPESFWRVSTWLPDVHHVTGTLDGADRKRIALALLDAAGVVVPAAESGGLREAALERLRTYVRELDGFYGEEAASLDDVLDSPAGDGVHPLLLSDLRAIASHSTEGGADRG